MHSCAVICHELELSIAKKLHTAFLKLLRHASSECNWNSMRNSVSAAELLIELGREVASCTVEAQPDIYTYPVTREEQARG